MILKAANRWQAFGLHLLVSLALFVVLAAIIYFWWYPGFLFLYDGGLEGMKLIAGVDFFIGPLLTLLVYKVGKKSLRFDLTCIALLQAACLTGGMMAVWNTRPVAVVYANGSFLSISYQLYSGHNVEPASVPLLQQRWPVWVAVPDASTAPLVTTNAAGGLAVNMEAYFATAAYVPYKDALQKLASAGYTAERLLGNEAAHAHAKALQQADPDVRFYVATFGAGNGYVAVNTVTGEIRGFVPSMLRDLSLGGYLGKSKVFLVEFFNSLVQRF